MDGDEIEDDWVNEPEEEREIVVKEIAEKDRIPDYPYIQKHVDLYRALAEVDDLRFTELLGKNQIELMKTIELIEVSPGQDVIAEGEDTDDMYFILATPETSEVAELEVIKRIDGEDKFITSMGRGKYFGQKYFQTHMPAPRSATVRVAADCPCPVLIGKVARAHFRKWDHFRKFLVMKDVPLLRSLPREDLLEMFGQLEKRVYAPEDLIITQGEIGDCFYIVLEGAVEIFDANSGKVFATLHSGHAFGETALLTDGPRLASVKAIDNKCICLSLGKMEFRAALGSDEFNKIVSDLAEKNRLIREKREEQERLQSMQSSRRASIGSVSTSTAESSQQDDGASTPMRRLVTRGSMNSTFHSINSGSVGMSEGSGQLLFTPPINENLEEFNEYIPRKGYIGKYRLGKVLGKGSFGEVFLVTDEGTSAFSPHAHDGFKHSFADVMSPQTPAQYTPQTGERQYALKSLNRGGAKFGGSKVDVLSEVEIMKYLNHKHICMMVAVIDDPSHKKVYIVQELCSGGPLMNDEMTKGPGGVDIPFAESVARDYFRQIIKGVHYMHSLGILHRDIKPQNVLIGEGGLCKLCDFGSAIFVHNSQAVIAHANQLEVAGTPAFMAPELFKEAEELSPVISRSPAVDMFSLGATLYCLLFGEPPWMAKNEIDLSSQISKFELTFPEGSIIDPHLKHCIQHLMDKDVSRRMDLDHLINNDWVTNEGIYPLYTIEDYDAGDVPFSFADIMSSGGINGGGSSGGTTPSSELLSPRNSSVNERQPHPPLPPTSGGASPLVPVSLIPGRAVSANQAANSKMTKTKSKLSRTKSVSFHKCQDFLFFGQEFFDPDAVNVDDYQLPTGLSPVPDRPSRAYQHAHEGTAASKNPAPFRRASLLSRKADTIVVQPTEVVMMASGEKITKASIQVVSNGTHVRDHSCSSGSGSGRRKSPPDPNGTWHDVNNDGINDASYVSQLGDDTESDDDEGGRNSLIANINSTIERSINNKGKKPPKWAQNPVSRTASRSRMVPGGDDIPELHSFSSGKFSSRTSDDDSVDNDSGGDSDSSDDILDDDIMEGMNDDIDDIFTDLLAPTKSPNAGAGAAAAPTDEACLPIVCSPVDAPINDDSALPIVTPVIIRNKLFAAEAPAEHTNMSLGFRFHQAQCIGGRPYMEDRVDCSGALRVTMGTGSGKGSGKSSGPVSRQSSSRSNAGSGSGGSTTMGFFGVYDGHNGDYVAEILQSNLGVEFQKNVCASNLEIAFHGAETANASFLTPNTSQTISDCLMDSIATLERQIVEIDVDRQHRMLESNKDESTCGMADTQSFAGSVAVMMAVFPVHFKQGVQGGGAPGAFSPAATGGSGSTKLQIVVAHVGDCRAVLSKAGTAIGLTEDHKPDEEHEKRRIEAAGGFVHKSRLVQS